MFFTLTFLAASLALLSLYAPEPFLNQVELTYESYLNKFVKLFELTNALSFYMSQNVLGWSKSFVPDQKFIYILRQSQTVSARQKDDLHSVKLDFVPAQKFLKRH